MRRNAKRKEEIKKKNEELESLLEWKNFMDLKFSDVRKNKAMLLYTWYLGDSDLLSEAYLNADVKVFSTNRSDTRNSKTYFWSVAAMEADVKKTHSGVPKTIAKTLINILDYPDFKVMKDKVNEDTRKIESVEDEAATKRLLDIFEDNQLETLVKQQQEPMTWTMGDGVFIVLQNKEISDKPVIEFIDARNCAFEIVSNRITKVYTRKYFSDGNDSYMLLEERGTEMIEGARTAYIKSDLFRLSNETDRHIAAHVSLDTIEDTKDLKPHIGVVGMDKILAVPVLYDFEPISGRGTSMFNEKMDLFDDLDQVLSQGANAVRLSTPVEEIDESVLETDNNGQVIIPKRFDRRYISFKNKGVNTIGEAGSAITSNVPQIDFAKYSNEALAILNNIITGLISPCTIGADISRKDNAEAQREKEKQTMFTRAALIKLQTIAFKDLANIVLKFDDVGHKRKAQDYDIVVDYEEYGNPTFDAKLQALYPAFVAGAISAEKYVDELWGDSLTDDEREKEIAYLNAQKNVGMDLAEDDPFEDMTE